MIDNAFPIRSVAFGIAVAIVAAAIGPCAAPALAQGKRMTGGGKGGLGAGEGGGRSGGGGSMGGGGMGGGAGGKGSGMGDPVETYFPGYDANSDGHLDRDEWKRRGNFDRLDADRNGTIEPSEFRALYEEWGRKGEMTSAIRPSEPPVMDDSLEKYRRTMKDIGKPTICSIVRFGVGIDPAVDPRPGGLPGIQHRQGRQHAPEPPPVAPR